MQEMTMVERVARSIAMKSTGSGINWPDFTVEARAAIEAMREPTEKMLGAFDRMTDDSGSVLVKTGYRAMIDSALSE